MGEGLWSGWGVVEWVRGCGVGGAESLASFPRRDLSRLNKHDSFWHVVSTGYFYVLFSWTIAIVVSDFFPLEIYKHLALPLSGITFTANSQADNHFYKYHLFKILYSMNQFFIKIHVKVFLYSSLISMWNTVIFSNKNHGLQKKFFTENKFFSVDYVEIGELHVVDTWRYMQSE